MNSNSAPRLSKAPFLVGDALLLAVSAWLAFRGAPLTPVTAGLLVAAVSIAAWLGVVPFIIEFRARMKLAESDKLADAATQFRTAEALTRQIASATAEWQHVHQSTTQTVTAADQIAEKIIAEAKNFGEVLAKINEAEKHHLRLEVDKLRRTEADWLQVVVRILDHVHALHQAGMRSGQKNIIEQLSNFQSACRDTARRLGLVAILPPTNSVFDAKRHQLLDGQVAKEGAEIADLVAPGYTFQGQLLRLPVVTVREPKKEKAATPEAQLSFEDRANAPA